MVCLWLGISYLYRFKYVQRSILKLRHNAGECQSRWGVKCNDLVVHIASCHKIQYHSYMHCLESTTQRHTQVSWRRGQISLSFPPSSSCVLNLKAVNFFVTVITKSDLKLSTQSSAAGRISVFSCSIFRFI